MKCLLNLQEYNRFSMPRNAKDITEFLFFAGEIKKKGFQPTQRAGEAYLSLKRSSTISEGTPPSLTVD